jgi:hypothetical protein
MSFCCRNCLLGKGYTVKICDWALLRSTYAACYFRTGGQTAAVAAATAADALLPLRWMPWEAFLLVRNI